MPEVEDLLYPVYHGPGPGRVWRDCQAGPHQPLAPGSFAVLRLRFSDRELRGFAGGRASSDSRCRLFATCTDGRLDASLAVIARPQPRPSSGSGGYGIKGFRVQGLMSPTPAPSRSRIAFCLAVIQARTRHSKSWRRRRSTGLVSSWLQEFFWFSYQDDVSIGCHSCSPNERYC